MVWERIRYEKDGAVAVLTLHRPERLNAMDRPMLAEIGLALDLVERDDTVRALVVTGAGKGFSSGYDLKEQMNAGWTGAADWQRVLAEDFGPVVRFWELGKPTIAAVHGPCLAGAFELALCCDITICTDDAVFGEPELKFGAGIVTMILPWIVGAKAAKEIIFLGRDDIPAAEALRLGIVSRIVAPGQHLDVARRMAHHIAAMDPYLVRQTKRAINRSYEAMGMRAALEGALDIDIHVESRGTQDKARFLEIARDEGLGSALRWRDARFPDDF